jgi:hypothetical protein
LTGADGLYHLRNVAPGPLLIHIERTTYLCTEADVRVSADQLTSLADAALRGGDANDDRQVNLFDLVIVGGSYATSPPLDSRADLNGDNRVDIFDLVMLGGNYGLHCPTPWLPPGVAQVVRTTTDGGPPTAVVEMAVGATFPNARSFREGESVEVWVKGATGLFGAEVRLHFDPARLRAVSRGFKPSATGSPGVPWQSGLVTGPADGFTARNAADNATGQAVLAATRLAPAGSLSGDVLLGRLEFQRIAGGPATVRLDGVTLVDREGHALPAEVHTGEVKVGGGRVFLPIVIGCLLLKRSGVYRYDASVDPPAAYLPVQIITPLIAHGLNLTAAIQRAGVPGFWPCSSYRGCHPLPRCQRRQPPAPRTRWPFHWESSRSRDHESQS